MIYRSWGQSASAIIKGGQAMLMRYPDARHSKDADLLYRNPSKADLEEALTALRSAAELDLGDHMTFEFASSTEPADNKAGITAQFNVVVGATRLTVVSIDLVVDHHPIGQPVTAPLTPVFDVTGVDDWPDIRLYPIIDHTADKICAMLERHGENGHGSTRYRDLVDLILIVRNEEIDGTQMHTVLRAEVLRRQQRGAVQIELPRAFAIPHTAPDDVWIPGYAKQAKDVENFDEFRTLAPAEKLAAQFVDPLLTEQPPGTWDPTTLTWR